jgi:hypothetical protein
VKAPDVGGDGPRSLQQDRRVRSAPWSRQIGTIFRNGRRRFGMVGAEYDPSPSAEDGRRVETYRQKRRLVPSVFLCLSFRTFRRTM